MRPQPTHQLRQPTQKRRLRELSGFLYRNHSTHARSRETWPPSLVGQKRSQLRIWSNRKPASVLANVQLIEHLAANVASTRHLKARGKSRASSEYGSRCSSTTSSVELRRPQCRRGGT